MNRTKKKGFLYVDLSKPMTYGDQFKLMFIIMFIFCALFTLTYLFTLIGGRGKADTPSSAEVSGTETSHAASHQEENSPVASEVSVVSEINSGIFDDVEKLSLGHDEIYKGDLILVNKNYKCPSDGEDAVSLMEQKTGSYAVTDYDVSLNKDIIVYLNQMLDDFEDVQGENDVMVACGYRSYDNQSEIFDNEVEEVGVEEAEQWVARPGYSEHQTGLVIDFTLNNDVEQGSIKYDGTGIYEWINTNSYKYGFILRYPYGKEEITGYNYESWHFRYVGLPAAFYITQNGITLEEYIDVVRTHDINSPLLIDGGGENKWYVYYVTANEDSKTEVTVPKNSNYKISGDNVQGFIVTADVDIKG